MKINQIHFVLYYITDHRLHLKRISLLHTIWHSSYKLNSTSHFHLSSLKFESLWTRQDLGHLWTWNWKVQWILYIKLRIHLRLCACAQHTQAVPIGWLERDCSQLVNQIFAVPRSLEILGESKQSVQ